jgi:hypothetical protein
MEHDHPGDEYFLEESQIERLLTIEPPKRSVQTTAQKGVYQRGQWYKGGEHHEFTYAHHDTLGSVKTKGNACYTCDTITDKWVEWLLTTPKNASPFANPGINMNTAYGDTNAFLFGDDKCDTYVYFTTVSPFQKPDFRRIVMTKRIPLLVPVYNVISSPEIFPSRRGWKSEQWVEDDIIKDLAGVYNDGIKATFDGDEFYGCCVVRKHPLPIRNIPKDNSIGVPEDILRENHSMIQVYHGGYWLLIKEEKFSPGDHLLTFEAQSRNYEIDAKIMISALV